MNKSGLGDSPLFVSPANPTPPVTSVPTPENIEETTKEPKKPAKLDKPRSQVRDTKTNRDTVIPRHHATMVSSNHATMQPRNHDTMIESVRKEVKELGKEAATHRFTVEEKRAILDIVYTYRGSGINTSENEVTRIAVDYILEDYKQSGQNSILDRVLKALNE